MSNVPNPYELSRTLVKRGLAAEDARRAAVNSRQYPRYVVLTPNAVYHCGTLAEALERRGEAGMVYEPFECYVCECSAVSCVDCTRCVNCCRCRTEAFG